MSDRWKVWSVLLTLGGAIGGISTDTLSAIAATIDFPAMGKAGLSGAIAPHAFPLKGPQVATLAQVPVCYGEFAREQTGDYPSALMDFSD